MRCGASSSKIFAKLKSEAIGTLLISHGMRDVCDLADPIGVTVSGKSTDAAQFGDVIFTESRHDYRRQMPEGRNPATRRIGGLEQYDFS